MPHCDGDEGTGRTVRMTRQEAVDSGCEDCYTRCRPMAAARPPAESGPLNWLDLVEGKVRSRSWLSLSGSSRARSARRDVVQMVAAGAAAAMLAGLLAALPAAPAAAATPHQATSQTTVKPPAPQVQGNRVRRPAHATDRGKVPPMPKRKVAAGHAIPFDIPVGKAYATASQAGWTAPELDSAYQIPSTDGGTGKLFATVVAYDAPNAASDLAAYRSAFGLPACTTATGCFEKVAQDGSTNYPPASSVNWAAEATLDIEMASAACPNCRIALVEANSSSISDLTAAVTEAHTLGASVINMSWGAPEWSGETSYDSTFASGPQYFASSGDCSASPCSTNWPAASPSVLSVGGTDLQQVSSAPNPSGDLWSETAWSGAVSGCSAYESAPSWQTGTSCSSGKAMPDVSADAGTAIAIYFTPPGSTPAATSSTSSSVTASPQWVSGWQGAGGTSASSPLLAALWALVGDPTALSAGPGTDYYDSAFLAGGGSVNWLASCGSNPCWGWQTGLGSPRSTVPRPSGASTQARMAANSGIVAWLCGHGDPVMCATGNLSETVTDLSIPGRGRNLHFTRTYNALAAVSQTSPGPLGYGWSDNYGAYLSINSTTGDVTVVQGDGTTVTFAPTSGGNYSGAGWVTSHLVKNSDGSYTYTLHNLDSYTFNASGQLISESDRNGYVTTLAYNASGQLASVTDQAGRSLTFAYNTAGEIASVTDPAGRVVSYSYDSAGNLTSVTDPAGDITSYGYDSSHRLTTLTDPNGGVTTNVYDTSNRVVSQTDPAGRTTTYAYSTDSANKTHTTTITDPLGIQTTEVFDQYDNLITLTKAAGSTQAATWEYTYEPGTGELTNATDPNGHTTTYTWDGAGNELSVIDPLRRATTYSYDSSGDRLTSTDPAGVTTTYTYTADHDLASTSTPIGNGSTATTSYTYSTTDPGDLVSLTDPNGHVTTYTYDAYRDRSAQTNADGDTTSYTYNVIGEKTSQTSPNGGVTSWTYDALGRVTSVTNPLGDKTAYTDDAVGNRTSVTDPAGDKTTYAYNPDDELTQVTNPNGTQYSYIYNSDGEKISYTDENGHVWSYAYNDLGRLISTADPLGRTTSYGYDPAGNRTSVVDPTGAVTTYTYDAANELTGISYSSANPAPVSYTYTQNGQRATMVDATGTTSYTYDNLGRLTSTTNGAGNTVSYTYDPAGNVTAMTYAGLTVSYTYDAANQMTSVSDGLGDVTGFAYDSDGNLVSETYPNHVVAAYAYNAADQPTTIADTESGTTIASFGYTRNPDSLITTAAETTPTAPVSSPSAETTTAADNAYTYTPNDQLASANANPYAYDPAGNLTGAPGGVSISYDAADEATSLTKPATGGGTTTTTYGYSPLGQRTSETTGGVTTTLGYNQAGQLTSYGTAATYTYNGDGLRMTKQVTTPAGGVATSNFIWDTVTPVPLVLYDTTNTYIYGPAGRPVEQINAATPLFLHQDQLGSTRLLTDLTGGIAAAYSYTPYGKPTAATGSATTPLGFAGQYTDAETGLIYMRARYYDPTTAQFITVDPAFTTTLAPYSYANDNPINMIDPLGLNDCGWFSWACDVGHFFAAGGKWAYHHPLETAGLALGAISFATGFGALADGAVLSSLLSSGTGLAAGVIDTHYCMTGSAVACVGAGLGLASAAAPLLADAFPASELELVQQEFADQVARRSLIGAGAGLGWDTAWTALCGMLG